jgi:cytochrome c oxidase subunit 2
MAGILLALGACAKDAPMDYLEPEGPIARQIDDLHNPVFVVAGVIFFLVQFLVVFFVIRYRYKANRPEPVQIHGNTRLEVAWTLAPALILLFVAIPTISTIFDLADTPDDSLRVTVVARQFWWEYRYDDLDIVTANELHIPVGRPVALSLEGEDVIHSFWVPKLAGKTDVVPGRTNHMYFEADRPGEYWGQCTEFCGLSHANMRLKAIAQPQAEFDVWVANQRRPPAPPAEGTPAAEGLSLFTAKGCGGCHTVTGVSQGRLGPDLTHVAGRTTFAGAQFVNTSANLATWLRDPPAVKPGSKMPDLNLTDDEITNLVAYLETLQ